MSSNIQEPTGRMKYCIGNFYAMNTKPPLVLYSKQNHSKDVKNKRECFRSLHIVYLKSLHRFIKNFIPD